jgi:Domain of unknown function (DUF5615)
MAKFYSNENFRKQIVQHLIEMGHDVLTSHDANNANLGLPDSDVISFANKSERIVLTFNRKDFIQLHNQNSDHFGIIVCTEDKNSEALAIRIHNSVIDLESNLKSQLIRINRPNIF